MTRVAIVGAGGIAQTYAAVLECNEIADVRAVVDVDKDAAVRMADRLGAAAYDDHRAVLDRSEIDAVIICTPPVSHPELSIDFLSEGIAVMCEKPLAISTAEANRMIEVAERNDTVLTMASKFRFVEDVAAAKRLIESGELGEVILIENTFASRVDMSKRWNSVLAIGGGGVLIDNGTHSIDVVRYLVGTPTQVLAVEGKRLQGLEVEDTAQLFLRHESGTRATIDLSWSIHKERDSYLDVYGSNGTIRVGWKSSQYRLSGGGDWVPLGDGYDKFAAIGSQVANFCGAVDGTEDLRVTSCEALGSVYVIEAAYASMDAANWVKIERPVFAGANG